MRVELAPHGVKVALIEPGAIDTAIWEKGTAAAHEEMAKLDPDQQRRYAKQIEGAFATAAFAAGHAIAPDKVARAIAHALTARRPKGRYVVGVDARLQAGLSILPAPLLDGSARALLRQPRRV
jgi:NAD(P)-dependent dehydrogenase (short-subunit alcohol dehydrogenase family)